MVRSDLVRSCLVCPVLSGRVVGWVVVVSLCVDFVLCVDVVLRWLWRGAVVVVVRGHPWFCVVSAKLRRERGQAYASNQNITNTNKP